MAKRDATAIQVLAAELARVRQRGIQALDRKSHNQQPILTIGLDSLATAYCAVKDPAVHGRTASLQLLLIDALYSYGQRGNGGDAALIHDLLFDQDVADAGSSPRAAGQLLDLARRRHGPDDEERFAERRRDAFQRFALFLEDFTAEAAQAATGSAPVPAEAATSPQAAEVGYPPDPLASTRIALWAALTALILGPLALAISATLAQPLALRLAAASVLALASVAMVVGTAGGLTTFALEKILAATVGALWRSAVVDLRGHWRSTYGYSSNGVEHTTVQIMHLTQIGRIVYGRRVAGPSPHSHAIRMTIHGDFGTGVWRNTVRGARHRGVLQVRIKASGKEMLGRWIGFDSDTTIQDGPWTWERL